MMINCKKAAELTCQSLDRPLSLRERVELRFHTAMCRGCAAFRQQSIKLDELFAKRFHTEHARADLVRAAQGLSDEACAKIKQRIREALEKN